MRSQKRIITVIALIGGFVLGGLALATGASSRAELGLTGTSVPIGAVASATASRTPPQTATAIATVLAGHEAFNATEAANFAPGQPHRSADPRNAPTPPASCPRGGSTTPLIVQAPKVEQHGIVIALTSTTATLGATRQLTSSPRSRVISGWPRGRGSWQTRVCQRRTR